MHKINAVKGQKPKKPSKYLTQIINSHQNCTMNRVVSGLNLSEFPKCFIMGVIQEIVARRGDLVWVNPDECLIFGANVEAAEWVEGDWYT